MTQLGCDSAFGPTPAAIAAAKAAGVQWWALYLAGPGAFHNWTPAEVAVLAESGLAPMPIYVPQLDITTDPITDAANFVATCLANGIGGAGVLDTEASMRGDPRLPAYEVAFGDQLIAEGFAAITYAGGFPTMATPPKHTPWWIIPGGNPPAGMIYQTGQASFAGTSVDLDENNGVALGHFTGAPSPTPPPPPPPAPPTAVAPPFPLPGGSWFGPPSPDPHNHSGYYSAADRSMFAPWQGRMAFRGWTIAADGEFGPQTEGVCRAFQQEKGLAVDGLVGPITWAAAWTSPVT